MKPWYSTQSRGFLYGLFIGLYLLYMSWPAWAQSRLENISTRAVVGTGDNVLIGGFIIEGVSSQRVLIRARGPSLAAFNVAGVLLNPSVELFSGQTVLMSNDDWQSGSQAAEINATGMAPPDAQEAALIATLPPGPYTAIVRGAGGSTGVGIVEVIDLSNPSPQGLTVSSNRTATASYDILTLTPNSAPQGEDIYQVQFDISGQNTFSPSTTVNIPPIVQNGVLLVAVPPAATDAPANAAQIINMRIMNLSRQQTSNVVTLQVQAPDVPAAVRGHPTAALQLLLKALYINSDSQLTSAASTINFTAIWDASATLGEDTTILDQHAEGILRGVFGISAVGSPPATASATRAFALETRAIRDAFSNTVACLNNQTRSFLSLTQAADDCFSTAIQDVRDVIDDITDLHGKMASIATLGSNFVNRTSAVGRYLARVISSAETTEHAADFARFVLSVEAGDVDSLGLDAIRQQVYDAITDDLDENTQALLNLLDAPDVTDALVDKAFEQANALRDLHDQLAQNVTGMLDDLRHRRDEFGDPSEPEGEQTTVPLPDGSSITLPDNADPAAFCTSNPQVAEGLATLGVGCTQFVSATTDAEFFQNVLEPLLASIIPLSQRIIQACGAQGEFVDSPACRAAVQESQSLFDQLLQAIREYGDPEAEFACQGSYAEFPSSVEDTAACIHRTLLESARGANCPPGSTQASARGIDVGNASVCVIYSRDFIQPGRTCREGYSLVEYLGINRCRWDGLSTGEVAAYSLDKRTGRRATVLP